MVVLTTSYSFIALSSFFDEEVIDLSEFKYLAFCMSESK